MNKKQDEEENNEKKTDDPKSVLRDFDDILHFVGGWGMFQYLLVIMFFPFNVFLGYVYLSPILTIFTPPHFCHVPQLSNLSLEQRRHLSIPLEDWDSGEFSKCKMYAPDWNEVKIC